MVKSLTENSNVNIFFTPHSKEPRFLFTREASQATKYQEKHRNYIPELQIRMQVGNLFNFLQHTHTHTQSWTENWKNPRNIWACFPKLKIVAYKEMLNQ